MFYVGVTKRLYTREYEHIFKNSSVNTTDNCPVSLLGIYDCYKNNLFMEASKSCIDYNNLDINATAYDRTYQYKKAYFAIKNIENKWTNISDDVDISREYIENCITEKMIKIHGLDKVRGGIYLRENYVIKNSYDVYDVRPHCECGIPCDINLSDKNEYYFRCASKNIWSNFRSSLEVNTACKFYSKFTLFNSFIEPPKVNQLKSNLKFKNYAFLD